MIAKFYSYQPQQGHGLPHDPIPSLIGPRPIGWISTCDSKGRTNLAPYSFFNIFNYSPPILAFSSVGKKDSVTNAIETGEFVYNLATLSLGEHVNMSSATLAHGESEFALTGLSPSLQHSFHRPVSLKHPFQWNVLSRNISNLNGRMGNYWILGW